MKGKEHSRKPRGRRKWIDYGSKELTRMKCSKVRCRLSSFADGELAAGLRSVIEEHLAGCVECRRELAELEAAVELLRAAPVPQPPPFLTQRVMAKVGTRQETGLPRGLRAWLLTGAVAVVLVAVGLLLGVRLASGIADQAGPMEKLLSVNSEPALVSYYSFFLGGE